MDPFPGWNLGNVRMEKAGCTAACIHRSPLPDWMQWHRVSGALPLTSLQRCPELGQNKSFLPLVVHFSQQGRNWNLSGTVGTYYTLMPLLLSEMRFLLFLKKKKNQTHSKVSLWYQLLKRLRLEDQLSPEFKYQCD